MQGIEPRLLSYEEKYLFSEVLLKPNGQKEYLSVLPLHYMTKCRLPIGTFTPR